MRKPPLDPGVADAAPEVARVVLHIDPVREPDRARSAYQSHLARAKWVTEQGRLLRGTGSK